MLPKKNRLTREQFSALLSQKDLSVVYNQLGTLKYILKNKGFSVVSSGKHEKSAVRRNRIRRYMYTLFQENPPTPFSGILYLSKQSYTLPKEQITQSFHALFKKILQHH